jgi:hypothetical protein
VLASLVLVAASLIHTPLSAQSGATAPSSSGAQLRLRIVDQSRAVLPLARVTIYTLDGNPGITVTADERGVASFPALPSGLAQIHATFPGFSPYIEGMRLHPGTNAATVTLRLAPVTEQVFVTAPGPDAGESAS